MADVQYPGTEYPDSESHYGYAEAPQTVARTGQLIIWAVAIVSMGLVVGMGVWAWQLLVRDVADVPVVRALEGPMRIAPENPGGAVAENQGLAVNRLAEGEEAAPVPDQLVLAPPPVDLEPVEAAPEEQEFVNASAPETAPETEGAPADDTSAIIERLIAEAEPLAPLDTETPPETARAIIPTDVPGVSESPRPPMRPAGLQARAQAAPAPTTDAAPEDAASPGAGFELAASELSEGERLVQLGAFDTADLARDEWQRLAQTYPDFFLGRARVIEEATSGGQTFYRLRAHGFGDLAASRRFCAALVAQGAACIPVTVR